MRSFFRFIPILFLASMLLFSACNEEETSPNILFCIADDITWMHMGAYGCEWVETPGFDYIAEQGILFNNAYTTNAKCAPSRSTIVTGRNTWQLEEACNHWPFFPAKFKSFMEVLDENGWHVGYTGKGWAPGKVLSEDGSKRSLVGKQYSELTMDVPASEISRLDYASNFEAFLENRNSDEPFMFWYGGLEPHRAYEFRSGEKHGKSIKDIDEVPAFWPDNDSIRLDMLDYALEIEWFDKHLVRMINSLKEKGLFENTLIVVTADNGMPFPRAKGQAYEYSNHLPLAVMWGEGIKDPGRVIDDYISFSDFAPTFLELAGLNGGEEGMEKIWGKSFSRYFKSSEEGKVDPERDHMLIGKERHDIGRPNDWGYPIRGIIKHDHLYIKNFETSRWPAGNPETGYLNCDGSPTKSVLLDGRKVDGLSQYWKLNFGPRPEEELYNIKTDPECIHNLVEDPSLESLRKELENQLLTELKIQGDPRMEGKGYLFDEYLYSDKSGQNFYERYMNGDELNSGWINKSDFETEIIDINYEN